jgi:MFS family permease
MSVTSLFSDWSYEMILPVLPFFLVFSLLVSPLIVGLVDGSAQFVQSLTTAASGSRWAHLPDRRRRASWGYLTTTISHGLLVLVTVWPEVLVLRVSAWAGRGSRQPIKNAIIANAASAAEQGRAFGIWQAMDSLGAVLGAATAVGLVLWMGSGAFRTIFAVSVIPGAVAVLVLILLVRDRAARTAGATAATSVVSWRRLPPAVRRMLLAEAIFGLGYFSILLALLRVGENLLPSEGGSLTAVVVAALLLYLLYNLVYTGISIPAGRWADRAPGIGLLAVSFGLFGVVDLLLAAPGSLLFGGLAFLLAGIQIGLQGVTESAWLARQVPPDLAGAAFGWLGLVQGITVLVGSLIVGGIWTYVSAPLAFGVSALFVLSGAVVLLFVRTPPPAFPLPHSLAS